MPVPWQQDIWYQIGQKSSLEQQRKRSFLTAVKLTDSISKSIGDQRAMVPHLQPAHIAIALCNGEEVECDLACAWRKKGQSLGRNR